MIDGIDVSNWQGMPDWRTVRRAGNRFGFPEATDGLGVPNASIFGWNWAQVKWYEAVRAAYHFFRPEIDPELQLSVFRRTVRAAGGFTRGDGFALDLETTGGMVAAEVVARAEFFIEEGIKKIAKPAILYTGPGFWQELGSPASKVFQNCIIWEADWIGVHPDHPTTVIALPQMPNLPPASFWQWTGSGSVPGVTGPVDRNVFLGGGIVELRKLFGAK